MSPPPNLTRQVPKISAHLISEFLNDMIVLKTIRIENKQSHIMYMATDPQIQTVLFHNLCSST